MDRVIAVSSGKGGVGKTTICCYLGRALAKKGIKTIIVELDCGLRGLDLMLGSKEVLYDLNDVLQERCKLGEAIVHTDQKGLSFVAASIRFERFPSSQELTVLCQALLTEYDLVLLDTPAGGQMLEAVVSAAGSILLVVTPDMVCVRDAAFFAERIRSINSDLRLRLLLNRVDTRMIRRTKFSDLDAVIDQVGVQLFGMIRESKRIRKYAQSPGTFPAGTLEDRIFCAIAGRILGENIPIVAIPM